MERGKAFELLKKYVSSDSLTKHALAVEAAMREYSRIYNEDTEFWGITGLLHDLDYEMYPDQHAFKGGEILKAQGFREELINAVIEHADESREKSSLMSKVLYAVDELSSFVVACVLVRPERDFEGLEVKSVKKKFKAAAFAKGVDRSIVQKGAEELGIDLTEHMQNVINALRKRETELKEIGLSLVE